MLKTISAALLAVSVIAAPALAETASKTAPVNKTAQAPVIKSDQAKPKALNANARMGRHHYKHMSRHHRHDKHMGALKTHATPKVAKHRVTSAAKRG
jgi:hypothetical protein